MLFQEGQKFKKDDILAKNSNFFLGSAPDKITYSQGLLAKVAIAQGDYTLEDSSVITESISQDMSAYVTMCSEVRLTPNTKILQIAKKHQHIKTSEPLITFEHTFEDADANRILDSLGDDFAEIVEEMNNISKKAKYSGEIVDIKVYYNVPKESCSESVQKLIDDYAKEINSRKKIVSHTNNKSAIFPRTEQIKDARIKGSEYEGIIIEFYVKHRDRLKTGDKVVYGTAVKTIVSDVLPEGEEPFSERYPDEMIQAIYSPMSIVSRESLYAICVLTHLNLFNCWKVRSV